MLHDLVNGTDLHGDNHTRRKFLNAAAAFKVDRRQHTKEFSFQHHYVQELHGGNVLVCVKDLESGATLLMEDNSTTDTKPYIVSDAHPLKVDAMREEACKQMHQYVLACVRKELDKAVDAAKTKPTKRQGKKKVGA